MVHERDANCLEHVREWDKVVRARAFVDFLSEDKSTFRHQNKIGEDHTRRQQVNIVEWNLSVCVCECSTNGTSSFGAKHIELRHGDLRIFDFPVVGEFVKDAQYPNPNGLRL